MLAMRGVVSAIIDTGSKFMLLHLRMRTVLMIQAGYYLCMNYVSMFCELW